MKTFVILFLVIMAIQVTYALLWPTDSTDGSRWERSGMSVYTDKATGVQYVKVGMFGNLTPRLNADGTPYTGK